VVYLIVGVDRRTFAQWHGHVASSDVPTATRVARQRAAEQRIDLVVAAVIGPYSSVLADPEDERAAASKAA
jgi:hypothetical protein